MESVFSNLNDVRQKTCVLVQDEVCVKSALHYHDGVLFGKAANNPLIPQINWQTYFFLF